MDNQTRMILALLVVTGFALMVALALFAAPGFASAATPPPPAACTELVVDGGFETGGAWQLGVSPVPPQVVTYAFHSGTRSLQMGITSGANVESFSSARQTVSIPPGAAQVTLSFWYYAIAEAPATTDYMEVALLSADGSAILAKPWFSHNDSRLWNQTAFDLTAWRGRTIQLYFNVYNDGVGGRAAMFLDDVSLSTCPAPATIPAVTATPTRTPSAPVPTCAPVCTPAAPCTPVCTPAAPCIPVCTPAAPCTSGCTPAAPCIPGCTPLAPVPTSTRTPTKAPTVAPTAAPTVGTGCVEMTQNGGFESGIAGWIPGNSPLPPLLITNPVLGGSYSLQLGSQIQNLNAFSSIRQTVTVPWGYARAIVDFWAYTWAESSAGSDRQQFVVLGPGNVVWAVPWQVLENERVWKSHTFDLSNMIGKTFDLYFAAVNDGKGGRTMLLLDEVHLWACAGNAYPSNGSPPPGAGAAPPPPPQAVGEPTVPPAATLSVVQVTPVETLSAAQITPVETIPNSEGLVISVTSLPPGPMWTEVAISGASAPNAAFVAGVEAASAATLTLEGVVAPTAAPASAPGALEEATAKWPVKWYWIVGGILLLGLLVAVLFFVGRNVNKE